MSEPRFACDAMLGGLARWLRAAGYDAAWRAGVEDRELIQEAHAKKCFVLSSDTRLFELALVRDGALSALWIPHRLTMQEQLAYVLAKLNLPLKEPRCMACGGDLIEVSREHVTARVPPRSLAWVQQFWECNRCGHVFWHGTHWPRIVARLKEAAKPACVAWPSRPWRR